MIADEKKLIATLKDEVKQFNFKPRWNEISRLGLVVSVTVMPSGGFLIKNH